MTSSPQARCRRSTPISARPIPIGEWAIHRIRRLREGATRQHLLRRRALLGRLPGFYGRRRGRRRARRKRSWTSFVGRLGRRGRLNIHEISNSHQSSGLRLTPSVDPTDPAPQYWRHNQYEIRQRRSYRRLQWASHNPIRECNEDRQEYDRSKRSPITHNASAQLGFLCSQGHSAGAEPRISQGLPLYHSQSYYAEAAKRLTSPPIGYRRAADPASASKLLRPIWAAREWDALGRPALRRAHNPSIPIA